MCEKVHQFRLLEFDTQMVRSAISDSFWSGVIGHEKMAPNNILKSIAFCWEDQWLYSIYVLTTACTKIKYFYVTSLLFYHSFSIPHPLLPNIVKCPTFTSPEILCILLGWHITALPCSPHSCIRTEWYFNTPWTSQSESVLLQHKGPLEGQDV